NARAYRHRSRLQPRHPVDDEGEPDDEAHCDVDEQAYGKDRAHALVRKPEDSPVTVSGSATITSKTRLITVPRRKGKSLTSTRPGGHWAISNHGGRGR